MCNPVMQTSVALVLTEETQQDILHGTYGASAPAEMYLEVETRDHAKAHVLAAENGAFGYYFFEVASVKVEVNGQPIVLTSDFLNKGAYTRVLTPAHR